MCGRFFKQDVSLKSYPAEGPAEDKVGLCYCHLNLKMPRSFLFCPLEKKSSWRKGDASPARPWEGADITCLWSWAFNNKLYYQSGKKNRSFVWGQGRDYVCPRTSPPDGESPGVKCRTVDSERRGCSPAQHAGEKMVCEIQGWAPR